jgi:hypothetical protein
VVSPAVLKSETVDEHLGDGLQGKGELVLACMVDLAVDGSEADAKAVTLFSRGKLRPVVSAPGPVVAGDAILTCGQMPPVQLLQTLVQLSVDLGACHVNYPLSGISCVYALIDLSVPGVSKPQAHCAGFGIRSEAHLVGSSGVADEVALPDRVGRVNLHPILRVRRL